MIEISVITQRQQDTQKYLKINEYRCLVLPLLPLPLHCFWYGQWKRKCFFRGIIYYEFCRRLVQWGSVAPTTYHSASFISFHSTPSFCCKINFGCWTVVIDWTKKNHNLCLGYFVWLKPCFGFWILWNLRRRRRIEDEKEM